MCEEMIEMMEEEPEYIVDSETQAKMDLYYAEKAKEPKRYIPQVSLQLLDREIQRKALRIAMGGFVVPYFKRSCEVTLALAILRDTYNAHFRTA